MSRPRPYYAARCHYFRFSRHCFLSLSAIFDIFADISPIIFHAPMPCRHTPFSRDMLIAPPPPPRHAIIFSDFAISRAQMMRSHYDALIDADFSISFRLRYDFHFAADIFAFAIELSADITALIIRLSAIFIADAAAADSHATISRLPRQAYAFATAIYHAAAAIIAFRHG
jgi:hypothetical protein